QRPMNSEGSGGGFGRRRYFWMGEARGPFGQCPAAPFPLSLPGQCSSFLFAPRQSPLTLMLIRFIVLWPAVAARFGVPSILPRFGGAFFMAAWPADGFGRIRFRC